MGGEDFYEWRQNNLNLLDGHSQDDVEEVVRSLCVIPFRRNVEKGEGVISDYNGCRVFVDPKFRGLRPNPGEVWFCSLQRKDRVYNATPLKEITSEMLSHLSKEVRDGIVDMLWETHRGDLEHRFEDKYMEEVRAKALQEAEERYESRISELKEEVEDLKTQLDQSLMLIGGGEEDGIELTSEEPETGEIRIPSLPEPAAPARPPVTLESMFRRSRFVPGIPEMYRPESKAEGPILRVKVERVEEGALVCDELPDGKYFVHISLNGKYMVIRPNDHGKAICINHTLILEDLGKFSKYTGRAVFRGEYSERLDGLLVNLLPGEGARRFPLCVRRNRPVDNAQRRKRSGFSGSGSPVRKI